jgi:putative tryptophan/tyrosine transport system substrate-binding protein
VKRREFITLVGGAAAAWPRAASTQQPAMPVIGFLGSSSAAEWGPFVTAFQLGLKETGFVEGQNFTIEYRWADGQYDRLPALAIDLVHRPVTAILAAGSPASALAAKAATATVPIAFVLGVDPVQFGLVASLNRPEGNTTGVNFLVGHLAEKALGLIHELIPSVAVGAMFVNPNNPNADAITKNIGETARSLGLQIHMLGAGTPQGIDAAFARLIEQRIGILLYAADPFLLGRRDQVVALAAAALRMRAGCARCIANFPGRPLDSVRGGNETFGVVANLMDVEWAATKTTVNPSAAVTMTITLHRIE